MRQGRRGLPGWGTVGVVVALGVGVLAGDAAAWKPSTHVALSEISVADALDDGSITLYEVDYALREVTLACEVPAEVGRYTVDAELANAVRNWPDHYRAGVVGPDAYPDMYTGQSIIHPDSKLWLEHVWKKAHDLGPGEVREKALAFAAGFLTHAAGDMYMHTFVNHFAGGEFAIGPNAVKHLVAEGYAARFGPKPKSYVMSIAGLEGWMRDVFLTGPIWVQPSGEKIDLLHRGASAYGIPTKLNDIRRHLQEKYIAWYPAEVAARDQAVAQAMGWMAWIHASAARTAFIARWAPVVSYTEAWVLDIDDTLDRWIGHNHGVAQRIILHEGGIHADQISEARKATELFATEHVLGAFGVPDLVGGGLALVQKVLAALDIKFLEEIKKRLFDMMVERTTGMTVDQWKERASETVSDETFNQVFAMPEPPGSQITDAQSYKDGELRVPADPPGALWDWKRFSPAYNTVIAVKLIFLAPDQLRAAMRDLGYPDAELMGDNARNILLGYLASLDGDNRWWKDPPRMVAAQDFCRYKQVFMSLTGELPEWRKDCPDPPPPMCGDGLCDAGEDCASCAADCGPCDPPCEDPCEAGGALDPTCGTCAAAVCDVDPFCCEIVWDATCVLEARELCDLECQPGCGDGVLGDDEDCTTCPDDCDLGACGDGLCGAGECAACAADCPDGCPPCGRDLCLAGAALDAACDPCVTDVCSTDPFCCTTGWDATCVEEVGAICGETCTVACGDGICGGAETCGDCARDCGVCAGSCGDGTCDWDESCATCAGDCEACTGPPIPEVATCGDGACTASGEDCATCAGDCGACPTVCGDGVCDPTEDCSSCPFDGGGGGGCSCPLDWEYCMSADQCVIAWECPIGSIYLGGCECCLAWDPLDPLTCTYCESEQYVFYDYCPGG